MIMSLRKTVRTAGKSLIDFISFSSPSALLRLSRISLPSSPIRTCQFYNPLTHTHTGVRGLFDGISGTWMRQMSYSLCRFWAYDESKKLLGAGKDAPAWKLAAAGSMGTSFIPRLFLHSLELNVPVGFVAGGIAGLVGNPGGRQNLIIYDKLGLIICAFCRNRHGPPPRRLCQTA